MFRAAIFDFDGVISDSEMLHLRAFNHTLAEYGIEISREDYFKDYLGLNDIDLLRELAAKGLLKADQEKIRKLAENKKHIFEELIKNENTIIEAVPEFLQMLKNHNITMAVCSGALLNEIESILKKANLTEFFEVIVSADQIERGKPYPDGFLVTLERLNEKLDKPVKANQCIVIEDSRWGLEGARQAGMHTVAVTNSYDAEQLSTADKIVETLSELDIDALEQICKQP